MTKTVEEKRCILCNKPYNYKYEMFGRGCLDNLFELLEISKPRRILGNKEMYLCNRIARKNNKFFLSKKKKYRLTQKYIALNYLNRMNYELLEEVKEKISKDIENISVFSKNTVENISFELNDVYQLFNCSERFNELIEKFKNMDLEKIDEEMADNLIKSMNFIFDISKKTTPIYYAVFYSMQYRFWKIVVIGGLLTDKKLSAMLLNHSLSIFDRTPENLTINDEEILNNIIADPTFKNKIKIEIENNNEKSEISIDNITVSFEDGDLLFALHNAKMKIHALRNEENIWDIDVEIADTYDFTDFKQFKEYVDQKNDKLQDIFATTLNNFGVASSEYGVLKKYDLKIILKFCSTQLYEESAYEK